jgi:hypothetical protein
MPEPIEDDEEPRTDEALGGLHAAPDPISPVDAP